MDSENNTQLEGFSGWLLLLAVGQVVGIIRLLLSFVLGLEAYGPLVKTSQGLTVVAVEVVLNLGMLALAMVTASALLNKKRIFLKLFIYEWLAIPTVFVLDSITVAAVLGVPFKDVANEGVAKAASTFFITGIWVLYTRKSKRVANTLVN